MGRQRSWCILRYYNDICGSSMRKGMKLARFFPRIETGTSRITQLRRYVSLRFPMFSSDIPAKCCMEPSSTPAPHRFSPRSSFQFINVPQNLGKAPIMCGIKWDVKMVTNWTWTWKHDMVNFTILSGHMLGEAERKPTKFQDRTDGRSQPETRCTYMRSTCFCDARAHCW